MPLLLDEHHPFARCLAEIPLRLQLDENRVARNERNTPYISILSNLIDLIDVSTCVCHTERMGIDLLQQPTTCKNKHDIVLICPDIVADLKFRPVFPTTDRAKQITEPVGIEELLLAQVAEAQDIPRS